MDLTSLVFPIITLGIMGLAFGLILGYASKKFEVKDIVNLEVNIGDKSLSYENYLASVNKISPGEQLDDLIEKIDLIQNEYFSLRNKIEAKGEELEKLKSNLKIAASQYRVEQ